MNNKMIHHEKWFHEAGKIADRALCKKDKCGAVVVKEGEIIGSGYNAPPEDDMRNAKCHFEYPNDALKPKSDRTCCMHAEWRAILDALRENPEKISGSTLYFSRIDEDGKILFSGDPYCTVCSRLALDVGIVFFALWHEHGIRMYDTKDYNDRAYRFFHPIEKI